MAAPQVTGTYSAHLGSSGVGNLDISAISTGSWMVVSAMASVSAMVITPPPGWTILVDETVSGTRSNHLFVKIKQASDAGTAVFTQSQSFGTSYGLIWGTGGAAVQNWIKGAEWLRTNSAEPIGSRVTNTVKSLPTTEADNLVLAISHEATAAMTISNEIANFSPNTTWTQRMFLPQVNVNDRIETIWMATKEQASIGASGDVTVTYISPQDNNGWTIQLAIPPAPLILQENGVIPTATTFVGNTATGFTINRPASAQNNDYVVVVVRGQSSNTTVGPASSGFTRLGPDFVASTNNSSRLNGFYGRPIYDITTEPTVYNFTFTAGGTNNRFLATAFLVRGVDLDEPVAGFFDSYGGTIVTSGVRVDGYALLSSPAYALFAGGSEFTAGNDHIPATTPTGYAPVSTVESTSGTAVSRTYLWVGCKEETSTSVANATITWGGSTAGAAAEGIALRTIAGVEPDPAGEGYASLNGAGNAVKMYHTSDDGVRTPSAVIPMRRGFNTVAEMLATPGFTWAHRGGSASYPEMSLHAYTQAVARGYGVLEVSLGRTSDGVWFGLHDQTTDRTSGSTYGNASLQTWAQVQAQQNIAGPGTPQPYMRWEELINTYGPTHIIVADPKYALGSYRTEFLDMVDRDLGPTKAIIKYSGGGSSAAALSTSAQARGYQTWGFFYAADASVGLGGSGTLQTWGPSWTLIGMEYGASQAVWNEVLALGKPAIGHIAPNQAAYDTAIAKGASGVQVSGVAVVDPVSWWTQ